MKSKYPDVDIYVDRWVIDDMDKDPKITEK